jgi:hypothetical protein
VIRRKENRIEVTESYHLSVDGFQLSVCRVLEELTLPIAFSRAGSMVNLKIRFRYNFSKPSVFWVLQKRMKALIQLDPDSEALGQGDKKLSHTRLKN